VAADDRAKLLGIWRLVALDVEFQDTGERRPTFGPKPNGYIIFTPEGRMMAYLEAENRTPPKTPEEQLAAYRTMIAYTGKYRFEGDKWITKVDGSWNVAWIGTEQVRFFKLQGDQLHVVSEWQATARYDNRVARGFVAFEREK
jgi:hypothetical protein